MKKNRGIYSFISWVLIIVVMSTAIPVYAKEEPDFFDDDFENDFDDFEEVVLNLNSNVTSEEKKLIKLYLHDDEYFISIDDLCKLTRSEKSTDGDVIKVKQGIWEASFDVKNKTFNDGYQSVDIEILKVFFDEYAVPAFMFLSYFKVFVSYIEDKTLFCRMPLYTEWEELAINYDDSLFELHDLYSETWLKISLFFDFTNEMLMGDLGNSNKCLLDAYNEALAINMEDLYKETELSLFVEKDIDKIKLYMQSDKEKEFYQNFDEHFKNLLSLSSEPSEWAIKQHYNRKAKSFIEEAYDAHDVGKQVDYASYGEKFDDAIKAGDEISEKVTGILGNKMDVLLLFTTVATNTAEQLQYVKDTNNIIYNVMGQENIEYLGLTDELTDSGGSNDWFTIANTYQNALGITLEQFEKEIATTINDKGWWDSLIVGSLENLGKTVGVKKGVATIAAASSRIFIKTFPPTKEIYEGITSERKAIYLSELQQNVAFVANAAYNKLDGHLDDPDAYNRYIEAAKLYCRTSIAMYQNFCTYFENIGIYPDKVSLFKERINNLAIELYKLTLLSDGGISKCRPMDLSTFKTKTTNAEDNPDTTAEDKEKLEKEWKEAYTNYVMEHGNLTGSFGDALDIYALVDINGDSIPELYGNLGTTANGDFIATYSKENGLVVQTLWNNGFTYIPKRNLFREVYGHMDQYEDRIYSIEKGNFVIEYKGVYGSSEVPVPTDTDGMPIYTYNWEGEEMSEEDYEQRLGEVYNTDEAIDLFEGAEYVNSRYVGNGLCSYQEILDKIANY